jgi:hypothetical protein
MRSNQMTVIVAVALLVAAWVDASAKRPPVAAASVGSSPPTVPATPPPDAGPEPEPLVDAVEPRHLVPSVAEPEPIVEADDGLAPYPAWNGYDLDCSDMDRPVRVDGPDPHRLDGDGDGVGCEGR